MLVQIQLYKRMEGGMHVGRRGTQVVVGGDDRLWIRPCAVALMSRPVQVTIEATVPVTLALFVGVKPTFHARKEALGLRVEGDDAATTTSPSIER